MDVGLQLQEKLAREGGKIVSEIFNKLKNINDFDMTYYNNAIGIGLVITEYDIGISAISPEDSKIESKSFYLTHIKCPYKNKIKIKEAIYHYLINNSEFKFDPAEDIDNCSDDEFYIAFIKFWFIN